MTWRNNWKNPKDVCLRKKLVFERILTKAFCQCVLNLMLKKKLVALMIELTLIFNPSCICHDKNILWSASFVKFPGIAVQNSTNLRKT